MKVSLVVAQGVHTGKQIPITVPEFLIGRDPHCQLRPASPAVSKQHCGIFLQDGKVLLRDYGSTNGTFVNSEQVAGEREIKSGDHIKAGPLEFTLLLEVTTAATARTPLPSQKSLSENRPAAEAKSKVQAPAAQASVKPSVPAKPAVVDAAAPTSKISATSSQAEDADSLAAMLFGMDDGSERTAESASVPDGSTVMELPSIDSVNNKNADKKKDAKPAASESTSDIAANILKKYTQRPRT